jgi:hypothetical protein
MSKTLVRIALFGLVAIVLFGLTGWIFSDEPAAKGKPGSCPDVCPRPCIACIDVYDPVICSNGHVYSNSCYAYVACATGCQSLGGGPTSAQ